MRLAAQGISYERVGKMLGFAKSTLCKWLKREEYKRPNLSGEVLELDGIWTRVAGGSVELKVARDERGVAVASAGSWEDAVAAARDLGADAPRHIVSDGDKAIESAIDMAYDRGAPHQLCQFHLLRECARNIGIAGVLGGKGAAWIGRYGASAGACWSDSGADARQGAAVACQGVAKGSDASSDGRD